ncbi:MAG: hypothetical protein E6I11_02000 [Chloroflexi bacterium]|nr:MAG: hypothetical protein E6I11_02000 [Chloroflexota bacterium]TMG09645.1 MAG: hypothetical protein E6I00_14660 [Chloroflexota bacterium]
MSNVAVSPEAMRQWSGRSDERATEWDLCAWKPIPRIPRVRPSAGSRLQRAGDRACRRARAPHDDRRRQPRVGIQTELWRALAPNGLPDDLVGFDDDLVGADDFVMPAAQHDAVLWLSGGSYDVIFDEARQAIKALAQIATVADETSSWPYQRYRDLTGFEDGRQITLTQ